MKHKNPKTNAQNLFIAHNIKEMHKNQNENIESCLPALVAFHFLQTTYSSKAATKNQIKIS
jgi:hypothetical protein